MTSMIEKPHSRRDFLKGSGALIVAFTVPLGAGATRARAASAAIGPALIDATQIDSWVVVGADGRVTIHTGKVELGTGLRTAQMQIAADELDVALDKIDLLESDTWFTPDQGTTSGSQSIKTNFRAGLRQACAEARKALIDLGAKKLGVPANTLTTREGAVVSAADRLKAGDLRRADRRPALQPEDQRQGAAEEAVRAQGGRQVRAPRRHRGQGQQQAGVHPEREGAGDAARPRRAAAGDQCQARQRRRVPEADPGPRQGRRPEGLRRRRRPQRDRGDPRRGDAEGDLERPGRRPEEPRRALRADADAAGVVAAARERRQRRQGAGRCREGARGDLLLPVPAARLDGPVLLDRGRQGRRGDGLVADAGRLPASRGRREGARLQGPAGARDLQGGLGLLRLERRRHRLDRRDAAVEGGRGSRARAVDALRRAHLGALRDADGPEGEGRPRRRRQPDRVGLREHSRPRAAVAPATSARRTCRPAP